MFQCPVPAAIQFSPLTVVYRQSNEDNDPATVSAFEMGSVETDSVEKDLTVQASTAVPTTSRFQAADRAEKESHPGIA